MYHITITINGNKVSLYKYYSYVFFFKIRSILESVLEITIMLEPQDCPSDYIVHWKYDNYLRYFP